MTDPSTKPSYDADSPATTLNIVLTSYLLGVTEAQVKYRTISEYCQYKKGNKMKRGKIYMAITLDEYELPVHVTDTRREMAKIYGMTENNIGAYISRGMERVKDGVKFISIESDEDNV